MTILEQYKELSETRQYGLIVLGKFAMDLVNPENANDTEAILASIREGTEIIQVIDIKQMALADQVTDQQVIEMLYGK